MHRGPTRCWSQLRADRSHTGTQSSEATLGPGLASKLDASTVSVGSDDDKVYALARQEP
jgi:hypothetical protein